MSNSPLISVIIPTYNRRIFLPYAISSVLNQTYSNYEIIIVNDNGKDVRDIIYSFNSNKITYISNTRNSGPAYSRNIAINNAKGDFICYLDDDDLYISTHLETIVNTIQSYHADIIYTDAIYKNEVIINNKRVVTSQYQSDADTTFSPNKLLIFNFIPINTVAHKRTLVDAIGGFNEELDSHEDWEFFIRLSQCRPFFHVNKQTVEVRIRATGDMSRAQSEEGNFYSIFNEIYSSYPSEIIYILKERQRLLYFYSKNKKNLLYVYRRIHHAFLFFYYKIQVKYGYQ